MADKRAGRFISDIEKDKILSKINNINPVYGEFVLLCFNTGLRAGEIGQYIENLDKFPSNVIIQPLKQRTSKREVVREKFPEAYKLRDAYSKDGEFKAEYLNHRTIQKFLNTHFNGEFTLHDARHTYATNISRVVNVFQLVAIMGWASVEEATKYVHTSIDNTIHYQKFGRTQHIHDPEIAKDEVINRLSVENADITQKYVQALAYIETLKEKK